MDGVAFGLHSSMRTGFHSRRAWAAVEAAAHCLLATTSHLTRGRRETQVSIKSAKATTIDCQHNVPAAGRLAVSRRLHTCFQDMCCGMLQRRRRTKPYGNCSTTTVPSVCNVCS